MKSLNTNKKTHTKSLKNTHKKKKKQKTKKNKKQKKQNKTKQNHTNNKCRWKYKSCIDIEPQKWRNKTG